MRGRDQLKLQGQDLMIYQMGEVVQIGVMIEKAVEKWIEDSWSRLGFPTELREMPLSLKAKTARARWLVQFWSYSDDQARWIRKAFDVTFKKMQKRNRIIHDQWLSFGDGKVTRFGYFPPRDGFPALEIIPGTGPGEFTHEQWEALRIELWHCWWRICLLWQVQPDPDGSFFFSRTDEAFERIRGEFYLGADYNVLWSASNLTQADIDKAQSEESANGELEE